MPPTHAAPDASTLRPWQFFTLLALTTATGAVLVVRGTTPANIILICLAIGASALVALGALRTLRPLVSTESYEPEMVGSRTRTAIEREKNLILRSLKELEFDHAMGKISTGDYEDMTLRLRSRAVRLMKQLDSGGTGYRELIEKELASRLGKTGALAVGPAPSDAVEAAAGTCRTCGTPNDTDARFCKECGTKLLLLLLAVLTFTGTAWAQVQMPDPKQMSGIPRPVTDLPEGHISVRIIRGQLTNNIPNQPVELHAGSRVVTVKTDENGRAEFSGIAGGTPVKAVTVVDGERLESEEFPAPRQGGIRLMLVATAKGGEAPPPALPPQPGNVVFGDQTRVIVDVGDDTLQVYYLLDIQNTARAPVNPPTVLALDLPSDAEGASILGGAPQAAARGSRVTVTGPFQPGQTSVEVGYQLPYFGGDVSLIQKFPVPVASISVLMKKIGDMSVASPQLAEQDERDFQGDRYVLAQGGAQAAGSSLTLAVSGLPHHSPVPRTIALVLASLTVAVGLFAAVRIPKQGTDAARLKQLKSKREKIFAELVRLEQQRHTGHLDAVRYADRRPSLIAQLERIYRELDTEGGQGLAA